MGAPVSSVVVALLFSTLVLGCGNPPTNSTPIAPTATAPPIATVPATVTTDPPTPTLPAPTATPSPVPRHPSFSSPATARQGTDATEHLAPDGYPWARFHPLLVDKYGKLLVWAQKATGTGDGPVRPVVSSDGVSWTEPMRHSFGGADGEVAGFGPPMIAYDSVNDVIHSLWSTGSNPTDGGIIYRRYTIERDAGHNITGVTRVASLSLDDTATDYGTESQSLIWLDDPAYGQYGALLAVWSASNSKGLPNKTELRGSMVVLGDSLSHADHVAGWVAAGTTGETSIGSKPAVGYSRIQSTTGNSLYAAVYRKQAGINARDLYVVYSDWAPTGYTLKIQRLRWSAATKNWAAGVTNPVTISPVVRSGLDGGYNLKYQLVSQVTEDLADDLLAVAFATWKDDTAGDTWSFVTIDPKKDDAVTPIVDVYAAGKANSSRDAFVAGDIAWDRATNLLVVAYGDLPRKDGYVAAFKPNDAQAVDRLRFDDASPIDIPTLGPGRFDNKIAILYRDYNDTARHQPPTYDPTKGYHGWFATVDLRPMR